MTREISDFSRKLRTLTDRAFAESPGAKVQDLLIAGSFLLRIRFLSASLHQALLPAFSQILSPDDSAGRTADFTIDCWESSSVDLELPPWPFGEGDVQGGVVLPFDGVHGAYFSHESGAMSYLDASSGRGFFWLRHSGDLQGYEKAAPLLQIIHWTLGMRDVHVTHAAAVATETGAALLVGKGGSGKSTSAALCMEAGMHHLCDDYCLLSNKGTASVHPLYGTAKLHPRSLRLAPLRSWSERSAWSSDEKSVVLLPSASFPPAPLRVILLPSVTGSGHASLRRASQGEALRALAPSSLFQLKGGAAASFALFSHLARTLPSYHLDLGSNPETVAGRIREAIETTSP